MDTYMICVSWSLSTFLVNGQMIRHYLDFAAARNSGTELSPFLM